MKVLVCIIAGLTWENTDPENSSTWAPWVKSLYFEIVAAIPGAVVIVGNYTDGSLPEKVIAVKESSGCDSVVLVGHSDGANCVDWLQDHILRFGELLTINLAIFLDDVTDLIRHGWLKPLDPTVVLRAIRIYQTADPLIHSDPITFAHRVREVENMPTSGPPFNHPADDHSGLAEDPSVQQFIVTQIAGLA